MPRIPQGEFDTNASMRVGSANVKQAPDAMREVSRQAANLAGAMAQLQDQSERTEAFAYANDTKTDYHQKRAVYSSALATVNGSGMADYFDPTDTNPDMSKRKRIQRPITELYSEMVDSYEERKKGAKELNRGDISEDLMRQYVGDDLIQLHLNTNKHLYKVREQETEQAVTQNMELSFASFTEAATQPDASPESIELAFAHFKNKNARERGVVGNILGAEKMAQVQKLEDRQAAATASQIISTGITGTTIKAADRLVAGIKDPSTKQLAMVRLENVKRTTGEVKAITGINTAKDQTQLVAAAPVLQDQDYMKVVQTTKNTLNIFTDPKYSMVTDEHKNAAASELLSTALAKRMLQEDADVDMTYLNDPTKDVDDSIPIGLRAPAGEGWKSAELDKKIAAELEASGLNGMLASSGIAESVRQQTISKMRTLHSTMKDNVADIVSTKYPTLQGREKLEKIHQIANAQGFGDPSLVSPKEANSFKQQFTTAMAKDPSEALNIFNQKLMAAGEAFEGESSYRRGLAIDLAGKDPKLAYLIPLADADYQTQAKMIEEAAQYKKVIDETDASPTHFQSLFESKKHKIAALQPLMKSNPSMYDGIKQAIFHSASTRIRTKEDISGAMDEAIDEMKNMYTSYGVGNSSIFALNRGQNNYGKTKQQTYERGINKATSLAMLDDNQKFEILQQFNPKALSRREDGTFVQPPKEKVDWYLQRLVTVEPDGRNPNMHNLKINGAPLSIKQKVLKVSAEDILKYGNEQEAQMDKMMGR